MNDVYAVFPQTYASARRVSHESLREPLSSYDRSALSVISDVERHLEGKARFGELRRQAMMLVTHHFDIVCFLVTSDVFLSDMERVMRDWMAGTPSNATTYGAFISIFLNKWDAIVAKYGSEDPFVYTELEKEVWAEDRTCVFCRCGSTQFRSLRSWAVFLGLRALWRRLPGSPTPASPFMSLSAKEVRPEVAIDHNVTEEQITSLRDVLSIQLPQARLMNEATVASFDRGVTLDVWVFKPGSSDDFYQQRNTWRELRQTPADLMAWLSRGVERDDIGIQHPTGNLLGATFVMDDSEPLSWT